MLWINNPDCAEARSQYYRLFSYQYAHGGLQHIGQNLISLLGFGAALESVVGPWFTFLFYETGGVFGALLWSWAYPFEGIVGCSCGIYGIIGGLVAFCILKPESMSHRAHIALAIAMAGTHTPSQHTLTTTPSQHTLTTRLLTSPCTPLNTHDTNICT